MSEIKLKPCPFCGKSDTLTIASCVELEECKNFEGCEFDGYKTICCNVNKGGCGAASGYAKDESLMIEKWNMREDEQNGRVKIKCAVCGTEFKPKKEMRYTGVVPGMVTNVLYDCYDCPNCGAQYAAQKRIEGMREK